MTTAAFRDGARSFGARLAVVAAGALVGSGVGSVAVVSGPHWTGSPVPQATALFVLSLPAVILFAASTRRMSEAVPAAILFLAGTLGIGWLIRGDESATAGLAILMVVWVGIPAGLVLLTLRLLADRR